MTYEEWEQGLPSAVRNDTIFRVQAFRLASFIADCVARDSHSLADDPRLAKTLPQLLRAAASVSANIAEGYPRRSPRDRVRYYEYALGSAAETKSWYLSLRTALPPDTIEEWFAVLTSITRLLRTMIRSSTLPPPATLP